MRKISSKTQISVFIVISAVIVILGIIIIFFNSSNIRIFNDEKSSYKVEEFIEDCLNEQSKVAINKIGQHGGWLYHKDMMFTDRKKPSILNKRAKGLDELEVNEMPYWYYYNDMNEEFVYNIPEYDSDNEYSLRNQLKKYIEDNLEKQCLKGFEIFKNTYSIDYEPKDIKGNIIVEFDKDEIEVSLDMPVQITEINTENLEYIDYFNVNLDNKLWIPYHIAFDITTAEENSSFIEKRILNFIQPYKTTNGREGLPPDYYFDIKYDFTPWSVPKVKSLVKQIVESNIGLIQFLNTDYTQPEIPVGLEDSEFVKGFNNIYVKDYLSESSQTKIEEPKIFREYNNYKVKGKYQGSFYPTDFRLSPSMGNVILLPRPEAVINLIPIFFTEYVAVYEMTMPIVFEIKPSELENDRFVFNLAIEANIDHNAPLKENKNIEIKEELDTSFAQSLICNPLEAVSAPITLSISDPVNYGKRKSFDSPKTGVEDAIVNFDCKGLTTCFVTQTKINGKYISNNITELEFRLPLNCNPGTLEIIKYGNRKVIIENINPTLDTPIELGEIQMPSKKKMKVKLKLQRYNAPSSSVGRSVSKYEEGFLIFSNLEDEEIVEVVEINYNNYEDLEVELTVGNYSLEGFLIHNNSFTIAGNGNIPSMDLDSWVSAGVEVERFENILKNIIYRDTLTVYMIDFGVPTTFGELQASSEAASNLKMYSEKPGIFAVS